MELEDFEGLTSQELAEQTVRLNHDLHTAVGVMAKRLLGLPAFIQSFSQRDPRWKDLIYSGNATFGRYGCYVTCCAMVASQAYPDITPVTMAARLREANCFGPCVPGGPANCLNRLECIASRLDKLEYHGAHLWKSVPADLEKFRTALRGGPVIAEVDFYPGGGQDQHFVLALRLTDAEDDVEIIDPWDGARTRLLERYAGSNWDLARSVYGIRLLRAVGG